MRILMRDQSFPHGLVIASWLTGLLVYPRARSTIGVKTFRKNKSAKSVKRGKI